MVSSTEGSPKQKRFENGALVRHLFPHISGTHQGCSANTIYLPRARASFNKLEASIAPSVLPAPTSSASRQ